MNHSAGRSKTREYPSCVLTSNIVISAGDRDGVSRTHSQHPISGLRN